MSNKAVAFQWLSLVLASVPLAEFILRWILKKLFRAVAAYQFTQALQQATYDVVKQIARNQAARNHVQTVFENRDRILDVFPTIGLAVVGVVVAVELEGLGQVMIWWDMALIYFILVGIFVISFLALLASGTVSLVEEAAWSRRPWELPRLYHLIALFLDLIAIGFGVSAGIHAGQVGLNPCRYRLRAPFIRSYARSWNAFSVPASESWDWGYIVSPTAARDRATASRFPSRNRISSKRWYLRVTGLDANFVLLLASAAATCVRWLYVHFTLVVLFKPVIEVPATHPKNSRSARFVPSCERQSPHNHSRSTS